MAEHRILREEKKREIKRVILREAEARYHHELLEPEERLLVLERVLKLKRELGLKA